MTPADPFTITCMRNSLSVAVIADIHANLAALEAVLEDIQSRKITEIISLGDNIGYGPEPEDVIQELRRNKIISIMGNHEYGVVNQAYFNKLNPDPRRSLEITLTMLSTESIAFIRQLEPVMLYKGIRLVHGCPPRSPTSYLFFPSQHKMERIFDSFPEFLCFYGHTHTLNFFEEGLPPEKGLDVETGTYRISPEKRYIINPGSVGQPRDGINNHAKYLIWDGQEQTVTFRAVRYDVQRTVSKLRELEFPIFNAERLLL